MQLVRLYDEDLSRFLCGEADSRAMTGISRVRGGPPMLDCVMARGSYGGVGERKGGSCDSFVSLGSCSIEVGRRHVQYQNWRLC